MKSQIFFVLVMGLITTFFISFTLIAMNVGFVSRFMAIWLRSWGVSYCMVVFAMLFIAPKVKAMVDSIVK